MNLIKESVHLRRTVTLETGEICIYSINILEYDNQTKLLKDKLTRKNGEAITKRYRTFPYRKLSLTQTFERAKKFAERTTKLQVINVTY